MNTAVFLDKDGTLVEDVPYNVDPAKVRIYPEATSALRALAGAGYRLVVVSNQPGVAHGYFEKTALNGVFTALATELRNAGVPLAGFFFCPHHPQGQVKEYAFDCRCRKPEPGLLHAAANALDIDLGGSWMIGDILNDVEAGNRAGCRTILVDRGNETEWVPGEFREPDYTARSLVDAAAYILRSSNLRRELEHTENADRHSGIV